MNKEELRICFLGTPEFALPSLRMLLDEGYTVVAAVSQPDRPKGRGHKMEPTPVKRLAQERGIPVYQYEKVSREGIEVIRELGVNLMITAAFGQILSRALLAVPEYGCINVHGSLLPKYRGAAPVEWAIINGETRTGVTAMFTAYELDAGDILLADEVEIGPEETGGELRARLAETGAKTLSRTLKKLLDGSLRRIPQDEAEATYYPMFPRDFGCIDFQKSAQAVANFVRALNPAPVAYTMLDGAKVKVFRARPVDAAASAAPGETVCRDEKRGWIVQAEDGPVELELIQYPGGKPMLARDFLRGRGRGFVL